MLLLFSLVISHSADGHFLSQASLWRVTLLGASYQSHVTGCHRSLPVVLHRGHGVSLTSRIPPDLSRRMVTRALGLAGSFVVWPWVRLFDHDEVLLLTRFGTGCCSKWTTASFVFLLWLFMMRPTPQVRPPDQEEVIFLTILLPDPAGCAMSRPRARGNGENYRLLYPHCLYS